MPLMSKIVAADLVDRVNGKYFLLALGEVVNNSPNWEWTKHLLEIEDK